MITRARALAYLAASALSAIPRGGAAQGVAPIRIAANPSDSFSEGLYFEGAGALQRYGVTAEIVFLQNVPTSMQAMLGGVVDVMLADMLPLAGMHNRGLPYAFFAGGGLYTSAAPTTALVVARDSPVRKAADLDGQTVSIPALASLSEIVTKNWLARNGANVAAIKFIELPVSSTIPSLLRGTVAASFIGEPFLTESKDQLRPLGRAMDTIAASFYISSWCASTAWLERSSESARRLIQAIYATAAWANTHHAESGVVLANATKLSIESVHAMNRVTWATSLDPRRMQSVLDAAAASHLIERPVVATDLIVRP